MIGAKATRAIIPKLSIMGSRPGRTSPTPSATAIINVTVIGPVATPPASNATEVKVGDVYYIMINAMT